MVIRGSRATFVAAWRCGALTGAEGRGARERGLEAKALLDYAERPPLGATLFVWASEADRRLAPLRRAGERGWLLAAEVGRDLPAWLGELAHREDVTLAPAASRAFLESGLDVDGLATALTVAALASAGDRPVSAEIAAWAAPPQAEMRVFALTDAILQRRPGGVAQAVQHLTSHGEAPLGLLALVARQMRQLASARAELAAGRSAAELAKLLGAHPFVAQKLGEAAPRWSEAAIAQAFKELLRCDVALKSGGRPSVALEVGLLRVAMAGR
jgi:DNA polymerase-3 subunit delta